ncbi:hypothetical protein Scep_021760 [Stephania cephalantha]|uniref:Uncharacterized protein n=1 Tax=Stephania cephalantha TaxID=152367 RepID=A0AAP0F419_9MAGN
MRPILCFGLFSDRMSVDDDDDGLMKYKLICCCCCWLLMFNYVYVDEEEKKKRKENKKKKIKNWGEKDIDEFVICKFVCQRDQRVSLARVVHACDATVGLAQALLNWAESGSI